VQYTPGPSRADKIFDRSDVVLFAVAGVVLAIVNAGFLAAGRDHGSVGLFAAWCAAQAAVCVAAGVIQGIRRRALWEVVIVGGGAAVVLAAVVLMMVNSDAGSSDCPSSGPCDTSFGLGAIVIAMVTTPLFSAVALAGRGLGDLLTRVKRSATTAR
jgi:hypothetical protein